MLFFKISLHTQAVKDFDSSQAKAKLFLKGGIEV